MFSVPTESADDRTKLVGTWKLVSFETEFQDGSERRPVFGKKPAGYAIFTAQGRMMTVIEAEGRKVPQTDEECAAALRTMIAYTGSYRIESDKWVANVEVSWNPAWNGTDQIRFYKLDGDQLQVISAWQTNPAPDGKVTRILLTWERST